MLISMQSFLPFFKAEGPLQLWCFSQPSAAPYCLSCGFFCSCSNYQFKCNALSILDPQLQAGISMKVYEDVASI